MAEYFSVIPAELGLSAHLSGPVLAEATVLRYASGWHSKRARDSLSQTAERHDMSLGAAEATTTGVWRRYPSIYEINTWAWLSDQGEKYRRPLDLSSVQALVQIPWLDARHKTWHLSDPVSNELYERDGDDMLSKGARPLN